MLLARHVSVEIHTYVRYMRGGESVGVGRIIYTWVGSLHECHY